MIGLIALAGYGAWYAYVSAESQRVASLQSQIEEATKNVDHITSAKAALAEIADDEAAVQSYFVPESGVVSFINNLEQLGALQKANLSVVSVSTAGSSTQPVLLLTLSITGTFDAVMRTVGLVEYAPYDVSISKFSIMAQGKGGWQANVSITVGSATAQTAPKISS